MIEPGVMYLKWYLANCDKIDKKFIKEITEEIDMNISEQFYTTGGVKIY